MKSELVFGINKGKVYIVIRTLYGLKSSGAAFKAFLVEILNEMGFKSSVLNPGVWYREALKIFISILCMFNPNIGICFVCII